MPVYATEADLTAWSATAAETAGDDAKRLLRQASRVVRSATKTAWYAVDADDAPTDTLVATAFREATCAQVEAWAALGLDPVAGPAGAVTGAVASSGIGGASVDFATSVTSDEVRRAAIVTLAPEAAAILDEAGLLHGAPYVARY